MATSKALRSCRLSDELYLKAKHIATNENRSFNNWLESIIQKLVSEYERENGTIEINLDELE